MIDEIGWADYDSGPFCRHWGDPSDCDIYCDDCNHRCPEHEMTEGGTYCNECDCTAWREPR